MKLKKIHEDKRGSIHVSVFGDEEITILYTKEGYARGGCIHRFDEWATCISGDVAFVVGGETNYLKSGQSVYIKPRTPHYLVALSDCVVVEEGKKKTTCEAKNEDFKTVVDLINKIKR